MDGTDDPRGVARTDVAGPPCVAAPTTAGARHQLSGYAVALGRHWFYAGGASGANAGTQAKEAAEKVIRAAPHMGEPHLALSWVLLHGGDTVGAVRELKAALARAPALAEAHEMLARILSEVGLAEKARAGFEKALTLDPYLHFSHLEVARTHAFAGRWEEVHAAIDRVSEAPLMVGAFYRARMAVWQRDSEHCGRIRELIDTGGDSPIELFTRAGASSTLTDDAVATLEQSGAQDGRRYRIYWRQLTAELALHAGRPDVALSNIRRSVDSGLIDIAWMDQCPLLESLRGSPEFETLRAVVRERAEAVVRAYLE